MKHHSNFNNSNVKPSFEINDVQLSKYKSIKTPNSRRNLLQKVVAPIAAAKQDKL